MKFERASNKKISKFSGALKKKQKLSPTVFLSSKECQLHVPSSFLQFPLQIAQATPTKNLKTIVSSKIFCFGLLSVER